LHTRPWRETSLLVDALTQDFGRVAFIAKGAKRPHSPLRGLLEPFCPVSIQFSGKLGIKNLTHAHWIQALHLLHPAHTMQGWYLSELCLRTMGEDDPQPAVFAAYGAAIKAMVALPPEHDAQSVLRPFEFALLQALGLWPDARADALGQPLLAQTAYTLDEATGWKAVLANDAPWQITGAQIVALAHTPLNPGQNQGSDQAPDQAPVQDPRLTHALRSAMRAMLARALDGKTLSTREVWKTLDALEQKSKHHKQ
jgi:DNA repair protein RecO (recombination protein O)